MGKRLLGTTALNCLFGRDFTLRERAAIVSLRVVQDGRRYERLEPDKLDYRLRKKRITFQFSVACK